MSVRLRRTNVADDDIRDIVTYIALDNSEAANDFAGDLWDAFGELQTSRMAVVSWQGSANRFDLCECPAAFADI